MYVTRRSRTDTGHTGTTPFGHEVNLGGYGLLYGGRWVERTPEGIRESVCARCPSPLSGDVCRRPP